MVVTTEKEAQYFFWVQAPLLLEIFRSVVTIRETAPGSGLGVGFYKGR